MYLSKNDNGTRLVEVFLDEENEHFSAVSGKSALLRKVPKMKFRNIEGLSRSPFVGCADSEDFLRPMYRLKGNTKLIQEHNASCWGLFFSGPDEIEYFDCYHPNPTREFVNELLKLAGGLFEKYWVPVIKTNLKNYDNIDIPIDEIIDENVCFSCKYNLKEREIPKKEYVIGMREKGGATHCFLCREAFLDGQKKVTDHDHFTGKYFGIAHDNCNLNVKKNYF